MFNSNYKEKAIEDLKKANNKYIETYDTFYISSQTLYINRKNAISLIKSMNSFINTLTNTPKYFNQTIKKIDIYCKKFDNYIRSIEKEMETIEDMSKDIAICGALIGATITPFSPTITLSTLYRATATKVALTQLSGEILAGKVLLALTSPLGVLVGGLLSSAFFISDKNKDIALKAENITYEIKTEENELKNFNVKIKQLDKITTDLKNEIRFLYRELMFISTDYTELSEAEKFNLGKLLNLVETLSTEINKDEN